MSMPSDTPQTPRPDTPPEGEAGRFDAGPLPVVRLDRVQGDLHIKRWEHPAAGARLRLIVDDEPIAIPDDAADVGLRIDDDAVLMLAGPVDLAVQAVDGDLSVHQVEGRFAFSNIHGDAYFEGLHGPLTCGRVDGDLVALHHVGAVQVRTVSGDAVIDGSESVITLGNTEGDVTIRAARYVTLGEIHGDLRVQQAEQLATSGEIHGDTTIAQVGVCTLGEVHGDLTAVDVRAAFQCAGAHGDAWLRNLQGPATVKRIEGSLAAQDLTGGLTIAVKGEAFLETALPAEMAYNLRAEEIVLRVRSPISAQFVVQSDDGEIRTHLPLAMERHRRNLVGVLGKGEATVTLHSRGDIVLDAAGTAHEESEQTRHGRGFRVHIPNGPHIDIDMDIDVPGFTDMARWWPFKGAFGMMNDEQVTNTPPNQQEFERRIRDLGERTGRAARKAAERAREYADRAAQRARETDWEAVSRDVRSVFDRVMTELETTWKDIVTEFQAPTAGGGPAQTQGAKTAQRITIERDEGEPVDGTASVVEDTPHADAGPAPTTQSERDARRRAILEQLRTGEISLEDAEAKLRDL